MKVPPQRKFAHVLRLVWIAGVVLVVLGSLLPANSPPIRALDLLDVNDKLQHFGAYALLALLPAIHETRRVAGMLAVALIAIGVLLEFGQRLSPGRDFEIRDMVADAAGAFVGVATGWWLGARRKRKVKW